MEALACLLGDEVHHATYSIGAIEGGGGPTDDLDALDGSHVDAIEVYHTVALGGDLLPVDEEENVVPRHALDGHAVLRSVDGDVDPWDGHLQGIGCRAWLHALQVLATDDLGHDGELLQ